MTTTYGGFAAAFGNYAMQRASVAEWRTHGKETTASSTASHVPVGHGDKKAACRCFNRLYDVVASLGGGTKGTTIHRAQFAEFLFLCDINVTRVVKRNSNGTQKFLTLRPATHRGVVDRYSSRSPLALASSGAFAGLASNAANGSGQNTFGTNSNSQGAAFESQPNSHHRRS